MKKNDVFDFSCDWLAAKEYTKVSKDGVGKRCYSPNIEDLALKILILTSVLAEENLAFRGTLSTMCEWLGISSCSVNNSRIKHALETLEENGYIFYKKDGRTYHISISNKGMRKKQVVQIRKAWVETFRKYNRDENNQKIDKSISISWIKMIRVFVWLFIQESPIITTSAEMAEWLGMSPSSVDEAVKAIEKCELNCLDFHKKVLKDAYVDGENTYHITIGTKYTLDQSAF